jgi:hypothetical protein
MQRGQIVDDLHGTLSHSYAREDAPSSSAGPEAIQRRWPST